MIEEYKNISKGYDSFQMYNFARVHWMDAMRRITIAFGGIKHYDEAEVESHKERFAVRSNARNQSEYLYGTPMAYYSHK